MIMMESRRRGLSRQLARSGALRCALMATTLVVVCAAPFADGQVYYHDWWLLPSVVALFAFLLLFVAWSPFIFTVLNFSPFG